MAERKLITCNDAVGYGAIYAGCRHYFGYPITPQNEIVEFFAREMPKVGGVYCQSESETGSISMVLGASAAGVRAMTTTSSPGFSLMQEAISCMASCGLPAVVVNVQRGGPSMGTTQSGQMDYTQTTRGGGHGGYKNIVLAPASAQETFELTQLAFHLADKYLALVLILSDGLLGQMREPVVLEAMEFGPVPDKPWALTGFDEHDGVKNSRSTMGPLIFAGAQALSAGFKTFMEHLDTLYKEMAENEVRFETYQVEDAEVVLVGFGSSARVSLEACQMARSEGIKVGVIRPISLWPFPSAPIREAARRGAKFVSVEDNLGQLMEDVRIAAGEEAEVHLVGVLHRHNPGPGGMIFPEIVLEEVKKIL